jgi:hypothetical protein
VFAAFATHSAEASPRQHGGSCTNVGGTIAANIIATASGQVVVGTVTGTLRGAVQGTLAAPEPQADGSLLLEVVDHYVTEEGFLLETLDRITLTPVPGREGVFHQSGTYEVTGGTGKFERANGSFIGHGEADVARGQVTVRYEGRLCGIGG